MKYILLCLFAFSCGQDEKPLPKPQPKPWPIPIPLPKPKPQPLPKPQPKPEPVLDSCVQPGKTYNVRSASDPTGGLWLRPEADCKAVLVAGLNGTGAYPIYYRRSAVAMAKAGFAVVWPINTMTGNGRSCMASLEWGFKQPYIVQDRYATIGHSQGGSGSVVCAGLAARKWPLKKQALLPNQAASGMSRPDYVRIAQSVKGLSLFISGDRDTVVSEAWTGAIYRATGGQKSWIIATGATHFNTSGWIESIAPLWFKYALMGDLQAKEQMDSFTRPYWRWKERIR